MPERDLRQRKMQEGLRPEKEMGQVSQLRMRGSSPTSEVLPAAKEAARSHETNSKQEGQGVVRMQMRKEVAG